MSTVTTKRNKKQDKPKRKLNIGRIFATLFLSLLLVVIIAGVLVAAWTFSLAEELPQLEAEQLVMAQTGFVYDKDGVEIGSLHGGENRVNVSLDEVPDYLIDALIATEDRRFYEHIGVDVWSVGRAVVENALASFQNQELSYEQGASTITMQLVRNVVGDTERYMERKAKEALLAVQFEQNYDKDEILYLYVNEIYLGPRVYGMAAAAEYYFNKDVQDISLSEAALLIGILRNPGYYSPYQYPDRAITVRDTVLNNLIDFMPEVYSEIAQEAKADELVLNQGLGENTGADYQNGWFVDYVIEEATDILVSMDMSPDLVFSGGLHIYTTMDPRIQGIMEAEYADPENFIESDTGDIVESGMAMMDPYTGEIVGLVGGREYSTTRGFNRATSMARQPGSSIKPIVSYAPAIDLGYGPNFVFDDSPFTGGYNPKNSDWAYLGRITMRRAVMQSRNVVAVKALQMIGTEVGWSYAVNMGLPLSEVDANNAAMALGGVTEGVSPLEMAGAFSTFANAGVYTEPYAITRIVDSAGNLVYEVEPSRRQVLSEQSAYLMTDVLMSAVSGGTGTAAKVSGWQTAGKTGTVELPPGSEDPDYAGKSGTKDIWFCGYTPVYSAAVWMGYDNKFDEFDEVQYMPSVYGGGATADLFNEVMTQALEGMEEQTFTRPDGLASVTIDTKTGMLPTELTPDQFIGSELVDARFVPGQGPEDFWQIVDVCPQTGLLATDYCPDRETKVLMKTVEGQKIDSRVGDYEYYMPTSTCTTHTAFTPGLELYYVCTHPEHLAVRHLANVAEGLVTGGCPPEYVEMLYYDPLYAPTTYCDIEEHALIGGVNIPVNPGPDPDTDLDTGLDNGDQDNLVGGDEEVDELPTPYNLGVSPSEGGCNLSWQDAGNSDDTIYVIERMTNNDPATAIRLRAQNQNSYVDMDIESGNIYSYRMYAYDANNNITSQWSTTVSYTAL